MIVGFDTSDDAGVLRLNEDTALVQTVDFFTPVADDPRMYGRIAAINSLSDVYAMGGTPISALSIVCYPQKGDWDVLGEILAGGQEAMTEAGVVVIGGHSVDDQEMKFGYAVTGTIHPDNVFTNAGAIAGEVIVLTKPIGTGAINTAIKKEIADAETEKAALDNMAMSSVAASKAMVSVGASACTDITGFGLIGHTYELAKASSITVTIDSKAVPLLPNVLELISRGMLTRGDKNNRAYVGDTVAIDIGVSAEMQSALFDPQTSGGLLISMAEEKVSEYLSQVPNAKVIGRVSEFDGKLVRIL